MRGKESATTKTQNRLNRLNETITDLVVEREALKDAITAAEDTEEDAVAEEGDNAEAAQWLEVTQRRIDE